jgi:hypothetical protein
MPEVRCTVRLRLWYRSGAPASNLIIYPSLSAKIKVAPEIINRHINPPKADQLHNPHHTIP